MLSSRIASGNDWGYMNCPCWIGRRFVVLALIAGMLGCARFSWAAAKPNIVFILSDDVGYNEFGFSSAKTGVGTPFETPNIDALAQQSVVATQGYVSAPLCGPSRVGLLTGQYEQRLGAEYNMDDTITNPGGLPAGTKTIASYLKADGYTTGIVGKWHAGYIAGVNRPNDVGFDSFFGFLGGGREYYSPQGNPAKDVWRNTTDIEGQWQTQGDTSQYDPVKGRYLGDAISEESVDYITAHAHDVDQNNNPKPFFLYAAFNGTHTPSEANQADLDHFANISDPTTRTQAAMSLALDREVGKVLQSLQDNGVSDNTIVVFSNDNGGNTWNDNRPYIGSKGFMLEGGIRVAYTVKAPGLQPGVYQQPVSTLDLMPTLLSAAGQDISQVPTDGVDLMPYLKGQNANAPHQTMFWRTFVQWAVRKGDWKLGSMKGGPFQLFNIANDPSETTDLFSQNPAIVADLERTMTDWEVKLPKPKMDLLGNPAPNNFDHFVLRTDAYTANTNTGTVWINTNEWYQYGTTTPATMQIYDSYANMILEFPTTDAGSYTSANNKYRTDYLEVMANQYWLTGNFQGTASQFGNVYGSAVLLVKSLTGVAPQLRLDATSSGTNAKFAFHVGTNLELYDDLLITGNGTQTFTIDGGIVDYHDPRNITKTGTSQVFFNSATTFHGILTINGGQVRVGTAIGSINGAAKIVVGNAGTLALDNGLISVPTIDNALQGDYNSDHRVNAADYTVWRDALGQNGVGLAADGNHDGTVNLADYDLWNASYGATVGGTLQVNGGTLRVANITGNVTNSGGTLASGATPSIRTIGGTLAENAGVLQVMIGGIVPGTDFDQIQVGGTATLSGMLTVALANGFTPALGQTFQFLTSASNISGVFSSVSALGGGNAWQVIYAANSVTLKVVAAGSAASVIAGNYTQNSVRTLGPAVAEPATNISAVLAAILLSALLRVRTRSKRTPGESERSIRLMPHSC